ncbi:hypothetical protein BpHYR1_007358 [Brachionus plicatilis]|uniref:Uncharacterized protein n=1 Tax=Brachionus plicatilis TaxID=10195 RepID=A0A3M7PC78_BRAPC|nr:hypothetical protein BpHYR1_007358 [Brachionus plicatilis]
MIKMKLLIFLTILVLINYSLQACTNFWDVDVMELDEQICPIKTIDGQYCQIPFSYGEKKYNYCIIDYPDSRNYDYVPKCLTNSGVWSACVQPTDAIVDFVTTRKNSGNWINTKFLFIPTN